MKKQNSYEAQNEHEKEGKRMLELKAIKKDYLAGENTVHALKGIDLQFRSSEFVAILGPSGCGKTTMLNIIGGLDQYTEGDLIINGVSTKKYKDRDWDTYRNHSIGFVFQTYNLIPHQTVLRNVELALTLAGVSKSERRERAKAALEEVGLGNQLHKLPNEMSGGQMQRVAIARALVNNPDIILADEPTGALDTETSVQVMEILKKISHDRLIIMVTHNPDLAERYSSRTIRMLDGEIISDSMPLTQEEIEKEKQTDRQARIRSGKSKKPSMSLFTSFGLSLKNLTTKSGRTLLTAFAGSIGIIGIALILSISQGLTTYIDEVEEDTLSSYPLTLEAESINISSVLETFMNVQNSDVEHDTDAVYQKAALQEMLNAINNMEESENDLASFKEYLEQKMAEEDSSLYEALSGVQYTYDLELSVYTENVDGEIEESDVTNLLMEIMASYMNLDSETMSSLMGNTESSSMYSSMTTMSSSIWQEMLSGNDGSYVNDLLKRQYDLVYGSWPNDYNEVVLVLDENNEIDDMTLYALGLISEDTIMEIADAANDGTEAQIDDTSWSYEEICDREYRVILDCDAYSYDSATGTYIDLRETESGLQYLYDNALSLKVVGVIRTNEDATTAMLDNGIAYTSALTEYVIEASRESDVAISQLENTTTDVLTGLPFAEGADSLTDEEKRTDFLAWVAEISDEEKAEVYMEIMSTPSDEQLEASLEEAMAAYTIEEMREMLIQSLESEMSLDEETAAEYVESMSDENITAMFSQALTAQITEQYAAQVAEQLGTMTTEELAAALDASVDSYTAEECAEFYEDVMEFSDSTWEDNLLKLGYLDLDDPSSINLYASSFENKDVVEDAIAEYNEDRDDLEQIKYTDYVGIMMSSITTIINAITYVLIGFVAISLIVSSIMIAVITLISVQERTKEIGILRAIGASKRDVSSMFNAETVIIGFCSGILGVVVTVLLCFPINSLIHTATGITALNAYLPTEAGAILVLISVLLTLIAGIIPSRSAAKKDPVVALRTE
ncbi:MAG: ATP-binding cassette domain-containing protein [Lachnospiraceae bacterium]|nr:ATP-binding cassette domain-containing protein [Lachnospiraceae bacterium]